MIIKLFVSGWCFKCEKKKYAKTSLQMVSLDGLSKTHAYGVYMTTKHNPISKEQRLEQRLVVSLKR